jgi:hypothetical protein
MHFKGLLMRRVAQSKIHASHGSAMNYQGATFGNDLAKGVHLKRVERMEGSRPEPIADLINIELYRQGQVFIFSLG